MAKHSKTGVSKTQMYRLARSLGVEIQHHPSAPVGARWLVVRSLTQDGITALDNKGEVMEHLLAEQKRLS